MEKKYFSKKKKCLKNKILVARIKLFCKKNILGCILRIIIPEFRLSFCG